jgi:hypothetical protein
MRSSRSTTFSEDILGEINMSREERDALKAVDAETLSKHVRQCLDERRLEALRDHKLDSCGAYIASTVRGYERALARYSAAKAARKLAEMEAHARRAGDDLVRAVQVMKHRAEKEDADDELFYVEDHITPPYRFNECLTVCVSYRWRAAVEDKWTFGSITFTHAADLSPDYTVADPKRKQSAAQQARARQDALYREWEHLMRLALYSVKEYLQKGGNAAGIPATFEAKVDAHNRQLNNFSARFWLVQP